jgi:geranylgeranyl diphosphate synthase type II
LNLLTNFDEQYKLYTGAIEEALDSSLPVADVPQKRLIEAMRYSLLGGGKRLRPVMLLDFCRMCGGDWLDALPFACALEMVHVYSLIHDDLPCMDNDDMRRGKPACHIKYGEATALLAGSALLSQAFFEIGHSSTDAALYAVNILANASGVLGIAGGQELDLHRDGSGGVSLAVIHRFKTAAMFMAAAEMGCAAACVDDKRLEAAEKFGRCFGLGFQYADDYTDGETDSYVMALGFYQEALNYLKEFENTEFMEELVRRMMAKLTKKEGRIKA